MPSALTSSPVSRDLDQVPQSLSARLLPRTYRPLLAHRDFRQLLPAFATSDLGDGMSMVTVAWLAVVIAPTGQSGLVVGAAVAAYGLPGAVGALVFGRWLRRLPPRRVLAADSWLRALLLGCVPLAHLGDRAVAVGADVGGLGAPDPGASRVRLPDWPTPSGSRRATEYGCARSGTGSPSAKTAVFGRGAVPTVPNTDVFATVLHGAVPKTDVFKAAVEDADPETTSVGR